MAMMGCKDLPDGKPEAIQDGQKLRLDFLTEIFGTSTPFELIANPSEIDVFISCCGGDGKCALKTARAILAKGVPVNVEIQTAISAGSILAMCGTHRRMRRGGTIIIHAAQTVIVGNVAQLRKRADLLEEFQDEIISWFCERTENSREIVASWFDGRDHWFDAVRAKELNLVQEII